MSVGHFNNNDKLLRLASEKHIDIVAGLIHLSESLDAIEEQLEPIAELAKAILIEKEKEEVKP